MTNDERIPNDEVRMKRGYWICSDHRCVLLKGACAMIRKLQTGEYRLYSRKMDPRTHKRRNLGTFGSRAAAEKHEKEVQFFKRH